ncbi:ATP-dependent DNA helicase 2 subunit KU70 isoform X4 [Punica granatum]|uniref:ATP-dependent DNA helicase 2 subunit KU70 isoform X3 n=1 Tax=Punica granatum TaxID=22663 RepID=A0A6P8EMV7_PUNGR|nr:ATP-dependent DNA helicase 2 subunit KU70 isoform X3 [Punica granatum]XP_031407268.1 ATP-dependent DNA helicase 2 subunit KU70 isoform X4 [Punica granatum]
MDMELDPDEVFRDDEDDAEAEYFRERASTKELAVYLIDASPKMFLTHSPSEKHMKDESHFHITMSCILSSLKTQIISRSYDEVAICFFNTREKKNLQDLNGVFVFNVGDRESLDRPTAKFIKELSQLEEKFAKEIGSQYGIVAGSRENSLYNALWVAQALLRKGSARTADKRILLFTNEDDPFGNIKGATKTDMTRTTQQRAKDAQDLGISIELFPLSEPHKEFDLSRFYADMIGIDDDGIAEFMSAIGAKFEDMEYELKRRMIKKRIVKTLTFTIANGLAIEVNTYALVRPTVPGSTVWLDSVTNQPLKIERSFICADTGALMEEPTKRFQTYQNMNVKFSVEELSEIKRVSTAQLRLLGFKPLNCLKDYHNLRPSTFIFPTDEEVLGSTLIFVALHRSMLRLNRFAVAFYGNPSHPQLVAIVAQDEVKVAGGQVEPPGMHIIYLPYADDIRPIEEMSPENPVPRASDEQIDKAAALMKRIDLKGFSITQLSNPALQRHYAVLQALALEEDELPETKDKTLPDEEGMSRPTVVNAIDQFKHSVYGDQYEARSSAGDDNMSEASKKRKASAGNAVKECENYNWAEMAESGKLTTLTVVELKYYLTAHNLPVSGKKEDLISRIKMHLRK